MQGRSKGGSMGRGLQVASIGFQCLVHESVSTSHRNKIPIFIFVLYQVNFSFFLCSSSTAQLDNLKQVT